MKLPITNEKNLTYLYNYWESTPELNIDFGLFIYNISGMFFRNSKECPDNQKTYILLKDYLKGFYD